MKKNSRVVIKAVDECSWDRYCLFTTNHTVAVKLEILGVVPNSWYSTNYRLTKLFNSEAINDN
jgi:hypothetical protein